MVGNLCPDCQAPQEDREAELNLIQPYDSPDQVTSGVLVEALVAGKPVIATRFPHAVEALASGAGLLVGHGDG